MTPAFGALRVFDDATALAQGGATFVCERDEAQANGFTVCLSGGSTPRRLYKALATSPLLERFPWGRTQFVFGDERFVPPDDPASNARMVTETMFSRAPVPPRNVHRVPTVGMTPDEAAAEYERTLKALHGGHAPTRAQPLFDVCFLGVRDDEAAARRFLERAMDLHGVPEKITIDKSGANTAAIVSIQADSGLSIELRQSKYLNNLVEQDHRAIKRVVRPMLGFKSFACARTLTAGIETMHMIRKGQLERLKEQSSSAGNQFYSLAF